jgi:bifunctional UDP-N-acetylglucosamine pyrophosphorylase/glucosamine-1-phosphate N-acetyltransferase
MSLSVVVLAAGEGKRFRSALPKSLHPLAGRPLLWHVLAAAAPLKAGRTVVVVGVGAEEVTAAAKGFDLGPLRFAVQPEPRGTGDALAIALPQLPRGGQVLSSTATPHWSPPRCWSACWTTTARPRRPRPC